VTQNSISPIAATPFCGLGTQTYNVPTTGIYSYQATINLPWQTSDVPASTSNPPSSNIQNIATVADSSGSLNNTYFEFTLPGNAPFLVSGTWYSFYYVWYNINSAGTDPAPAGGFGIQVTGATGASANTLAGNTRTAIAAALPTTGNTYVVSGATNHIILTALQNGLTTAAVDTGTTGFTFVVTAAGSFGYASGLVCTVKRTTSGPTTTILQSASQPSPTQPLMALQGTGACLAGDTITVITSSLATADAGLNAVKGIINIFFGPL
jgi:hypothetical protein